MQKNNLIILVICQLISATGSVVIVTLGGIIGADLTSNPAWSTLPISMMVVAIAATTIPATLLMRRLGRSRGFAIASLSAVIAVLVAAYALSEASFAMFMVAAAMFGINMAFTQQYRYAAAESVPARYTARAVSFVLVGSIGGALIGPELATRGQNWVSDVPYAGTMLALAALYLVQAVLLLRLKSADEAFHEDDVRPSRGLRQIVRQPVFLVAVLGGTVGYGLMTLVMTATPLSMHINDGYSIEQTASVIRAHVLGMYVPSLVSGFLIERLGVTRMMFFGALGLLATSIVALQGQSVLHYWGALILLGVGWNFLYVGGTTMLTYTYSMSERFQAQAANEFLVFGTSAIASLLAGTVMHYFGWSRLMLVPIPILLIIFVALLLVRRDPLLRRSQTLTKV
ncbi:MAG: MFS transporter [Proteobacteria bacterium]|nr:MFS transporter [Pseudomonadota bacterium]